MRLLAILPLALSLLFGQENGIFIPSDPVPDREPEFDAIVAKEDSPESEEVSQPVFESLELEGANNEDQTRVSILGYHDFSSDLPETAMRIKTPVFRKQMEALKALGHPIITLEQFEAWKSGQAPLPAERAFLITIDDGWKSVYTDAWPVFKELDIPFTLFLYKKYVDGGELALSTQMIEEMLASGLCSIGSHSVTHPFPSKFKAAKKRGEKAHLDFLNTEFGESKRFLEEKFNRPIKTYAYPGGYVTPDMLPVAQDQGYEFLFTVNPGMTRLTSDNLQLPRFIILGNRDFLFEMATTFRNSNGGLEPGAIVQNTNHPVTPKPGELIASRLPLIAVDLSQETTLDPESLVMRVGGFGKVPAEWDDEKKTYSWKINRPLRTLYCNVSVQWRLKENIDYEPPMRWSFRINLEEAYQP